MINFEKQGSFKEEQDKLIEFLASIGNKGDLNNKIVMTAKDGEAYLGAGTLELNGSKVYLNFIGTKDEDLVLKLSILKSLLNLADLRGIKNVYGNNFDLENLYK